MHSHYTNKLLNIEDVIIKKIRHAETFVKIYLETKPHEQVCPCCGATTKRIHDAKDVFGIEAEGTDINAGKLNHEGYISVAKQICDKFGCEKVAITLRSSISANDNDWAAMLYTDGEVYFSPSYRIHIVDRVGGGDSFMGGLIYGLLTYKNDDQKALEFAAAASCLKHTVYGDFNLVTADEVENLMKGDGSGRVVR